MKKSLFFIIVLASSLVARAQDVSSLYIGLDAQNVAGVSVAKAANAYSAENNASAISFAETNYSFSAGYGMWAPSNSNSNIIGLGGFARIGSKLGVGLFGRKITDSQGVVVTNQNSVSSGTYYPSDMVLGLGASYAITENLSAGVSAKILSCSLAPDYKYSGFFADISATYVKDALRAGIALSNLFSALSARVGASYTIAGLTPSLELVVPTAGGFAAAGSVEYGIMDMAFVRAGYHYGSGAAVLPSYASAGVGFKFAGVSLDFAYLLASDTIGGSMLFNLGYAF
ncbi:MAG: hypothetical protein J5748_02970 [Bacteroidales bacterium]|nr:hypothetical protein [Bacteroidales bacterium]